MIERPNVILILTDDQGYGDLSCTGNPVLQTPHLDKLYDQSVRLTDYHVDAMCSPTRAALMTGRYAARTGVWSTLRGRYIMRRDEITIADVFSNSDYRTGIFGKWHLGDNYPYRPFDRGFRESLSFGGGVVGEIPDYWDNDNFTATYLRNGVPEQHTLAIAQTYGSTKPCNLWKRMKPHSSATSPPTPPMAHSMYTKNTAHHICNRAYRNNARDFTA